MEQNTLASPRREVGLVAGIKEAQSKIIRDELIIKIKVAHPVRGGIG